MEKCDCKFIKIDATKYGGSKKDMIITINKVKDVEDKNRNAHLYFHQGAFVFNGGAADPSGEGKRVQPEACRQALSFDVTCFGVDYGVAPEVKGPDSAMNCYAALRYIIDNASELNINPKNITFGGDSAGGCHSAMLMYQLALRNEAQLAKFGFVDVGPTSNHWYDLDDSKRLHVVETKSRLGNLLPMSMVAKHDTTYEKEQEKNKDLTKIEYCQLICDMIKDDPVYYPALMSDDLAKRCPPVFITTREFDLYRHDSNDFGALMKRNGRLLMEVYTQPGTSHMSTFTPDDKKPKVFEGQAEATFPGRTEFEEAQQKFYKHFAEMLFEK